VTQHGDNRDESAKSWVSLSEYLCFDAGIQPRGNTVSATDARRRRNRKERLSRSGRAGLMRVKEGGRYGYGYLQ
jgi:hypothetical protein